MLKVSLRKVLRSDWDYILKLRNVSKFRTFFYDQHTITKKEHYKYLQQQKNNKHFFNWIICYGNTNAGYLRVLDNDVSIIIDAKYQNKGIGSKALRLLENEAKKLGIKKLIGRVMIHNKKSARIFERNGYKLIMYWYEKKIT